MFDRFEKLIGTDVFNVVKNIKVMIIGIGGVGGYAAVSLARSGVGNIVVADYDIVDVSNINRQIIAYKSTIGLKKVDVMEKMLKDINEDILVDKISSRVTFFDIEGYIDKYNPDYLIDACDDVKLKKKIISLCTSRKIKFISSMGTGNKFDPSKFEIMDIRRTMNDPIARILRKYVKDERINDKVMVVSSSEVPKKVGPYVYSNSFVPASAGLLITSYVINDIIKQNKKVHDWTFLFICFYISI